MSSNPEFVFDKAWSAGYRQDGDKFHISVNLNRVMAPNRTTYGGGGPAVTQECSTIEQLESEVERLKSDLDKALDQARKAIAKEPIQRGF